MVDVIVPVYTRNETSEQMAYKSLAQLRANSPDYMRLIVVDNGWHEDRDFGADVYIRFDENRGYAGGVNAGLDVCNAATVVVSSIDVFVPVAWMYPLVVSAQETIGVISPLARRYLYGVDTGEDEVPNCVYWGGIFAVPLFVMRELGGMDAVNFPLRYADTDFGVRAAKAGFFVARQPMVTVEHHDPSMSTLFMDRGEQDAELAKLQAIHGKFPMHEWHLGHFQK